MQFNCPNPCAPREESVGQLGHLLSQHNIRHTSGRVGANTPHRRVSQSTRMELHAAKCRAFRKGILADVRHAGGDQDRPQTNATLERGITDVRHRVGNRHCFKRGLIGECECGNSSHVIRNFDGGGCRANIAQQPTVLDPEAALAKLLAYATPVLPVNTHQRRATVEEPIGQRPDLRAKNNVRQAGIRIGEKILQGRSLPTHSLN